MVSRVYIALAIAPFRISIEIGFVKNLSAPLSMHLCWLFSSVDDVRIMTGIWLVLGFFFTFSQSSAPSIPSIIRSVMIASGMVVVIFDHQSINVEFRVVVMTLEYRNVVMLIQNLVRLRLLAKEPYIDIAARSVVRNGVESCKSDTLENHQLQTVAAACGYNLVDHHHALADAEACAWIAREIL